MTAATDTDRIAATSMNPFTLFVRAGIFRCVAERTGST